jgi:hypothetical protein
MRDMKNVLCIGVILVSGIASACAASPATPAIPPAVQQVVTNTPTARLGGPLIVATPTERTSLIANVDTPPPRQADVKRFTSDDGRWLAISTVSGLQRDAINQLVITRLRDGTMFEHALLADAISAVCQGKPAISDAETIKAFDACTSIFFERGAWSADSRYFAFSSAQDGPSADVYAFDTQREQFLRLSDGPTQVVSLRWSPDAAWVAYVGVENFGTGAGRDDDAVWLASPSDAPARKLYAPPDGYTITELAWVDATHVSIQANVINPSMPMYRYVVDVETGERVAR